MTVSTTSSSPAVASSKYSKSQTARHLQSLSPRAGEKELQP